MATGKPSHKKPKQREELIEESVSLDLEGYTLREIGELLDISHEQVRRYLLIAQDRFISDSKDLVAYHKKKSVKDLLKIQRLALMEYERSREDVEKTTVKTSTGGQFGPTTDTTITTHERLGEAALLRVASDAIDKKNKTLGIYHEEDDTNTEANQALKDITKALGQKINKHVTE